jgi:two-component system cell cycle sensor histidine kinase/response regulator CckA
MELPLDIIVNSLEDAILCLDDQSTVLLLNDAAAKLFKCDRGQIAGRPATAISVVGDAVRQLNLGELTAPNAPESVVRTLQLRTGAEPLPVVAAVSLAGTLTNGRRVFTVAVRDVSLQQHLEKTVYEARKTQALGSLASGIAHDFNNVLAAVISQIDLVLHAPECPTSLKQHLIYAQTSARRGAELVNKLQTFTRQTKSVLDTVNLKEVVDEVVFMLRRSIDPKVIVEPPRSEVKPWLVKADLNQILQALLNLGINARDAMPQGGRLSFVLEHVSFPSGVPTPRRPGDFVRVSVADTGHGMAPEVLSRIFEPYYSTKDLSRGPGLGLSIASAVIAEHAGWIEVESEAGKGARFHVFLPRCTEPVAAPKSAVRIDTKAVEGKERILVVDDEELVRMVTKAVLAYRGYQVTEAQDGEQAVEKYAANPGGFDLVLMDLHMPRLNGYDALRRIREINPKARAIMLSGGVQDPEEGLADMTGVGFLHKPFENQELVRLVRQLLDQS